MAGTLMERVNGWIGERGNKSGIKGPRGRGRIGYGGGAGGGTSVPRPKVMSIATPATSIPRPNGNLSIPRPKTGGTSIPRPTGGAVVRGIFGKL